MLTEPHGCLQGASSQHGALHLKHHPSFLLSSVSSLGILHSRHISEVWMERQRNPMSLTRLILWTIQGWNFNHLQLRTNLLYTRVARKQSESANSNKWISRIAGCYCFACFRRSIHDSCAFKPSDTWMYEQGLNTGTQSMSWDSCVCSFALCSSQS